MGVVIVNQPTIDQQEPRRIQIHKVNTPDSGIAEQ